MGPQQDIHVCRMSVGPQLAVHATCHGTPGIISQDGPYFAKLYFFLATLLRKKGAEGRRCRRRRRRLRPMFPRLRPRCRW